MNSGKTKLGKILYVAMRYDYGKKVQGTSFEFNNFYRTLERMTPAVVEFDFMTICQASGREVMNNQLLELARRERPDLIFFVLFTDEFDYGTLRQLTSEFTTFNWFCDDHWRFSNYSRYYAPLFSYVSTTDHAAIARYKKIGYPNALLTQWACNHYDYVRMQDLAKQNDVTFIGQPHGNRRAVVNYLRRNNIPVETYGQGWETGRVSQEEMIRIFNCSKINLNLSNSSLNIHTLFQGRQQIKGRNFEIPGCGGFLLTNYVDNLEHYYQLGEEIVCFSTKRDLREKIQYYLHHAQEREEIARRGYERTQRDHTYTKRLSELFAAMGFEL